MLNSSPTPPLTAGACESVRTFVATPADSCGTLLHRVAATLAESAEQPLMVMLFGRNDATAGAARILAGIPGGADWPLLVAEGEPCHDGPMAGAQVFTLPATTGVQHVRIGNRIVGSVFEDGEARHCLLAGIGPLNSGLTEGTQANETFSILGGALKVAGFAFADIVRTWFYNRDILEWYDDFNRVRSAFYRYHPFRTGSLPASTGIEGSNPAGTALTVAAWAVQPLSGSAVIRELASPLQCPAPAYGSAFSRAMEITSGGRTRLLVSGTASIAPGGASIWPGDPARQVAQTMEVIGAILRSRDLDFSEVVRASAYFKHIADLPHFESWLRAHDLATLPFVPMHCDVCRDDLLFELELDACR